MMSKLRIFSFVVGLVALTSNAQAAGVSFDGRIIKPDTTPLESNSVQFKIQIRTPGAEDCLMYEETRSLDMTASQGFFALTLNDGSGTRTDSATYAFDKLFVNYGSFSFSGGACASGSTFTPSPGSERKIVVSFREAAGAWEVLPAQKLTHTAVAVSASNADSLQGLKPEALVRVIDGGTPGNISPLSNTQYTELMALVNGTSNVYGRPNQINGQTIPALTAGQSLGWNGSGWVGVTQPAPGIPTDSWSDVSLRTGGVDRLTVTMTGNVGIGTTTPSAALEVAGTGRFTTVQISSGTAASPALSFTGSSNTGIYSPSTGVFNISASGTDVVNLSNSGVMLNKTVTAQSGAGVTYSPTGSGVAPGSEFNTPLILRKNAFGDNNVNNIRFTSTNSSSNPQNAYIGTVTTTGAGYSPALVFGQQTGANNYQESMRLTPTGALAIGTVNPDPVARFEVAGPIKLGTSGSVVQAMGVCSVSSFQVYGATANTASCTGLPLNAAVNCSPVGTTPPPAATWSAFTSSAGQVGINFASASPFTSAWKCSWVL